MSSPFNKHWSQHNESIIKILEDELPQSTLYWLLISICAAIAWIVYLTYYNSRVIGLILTAIINRFVKFGYVHVGSFSISVLAGKIMFRDVYLITENYSLRIQLGLAIFRWWRPLTRRKINEDLSHSETRLSIYLDSFVLHVYNRTSEYSRLEQLFGLEQLITGYQNTTDVPNASDGSPDHAAASKKPSWQWRDLVPVIKIECTAGRLVFGNYLLPQTLSINFGDLHLVYTTKPASTPFDQFMHILKCKSDNLRIMLVPSPKYVGKIDEPPRCMGDGFVILQSSDVDIYYYQDEPGKVPDAEELVQLANGDVMTVRTWPCWGMDVKYGKNTDISYGPWADRQREFLWRFFYPPDYQPIKTTQLPERGQWRQWKSFDFKMSMQNDVTIDILFTKNKETQALHMHSKQGTYLEFSIPFFVDNGYSTKINGQLMHIDATTSLKFRSLLACETLEFSVEVKYPSVWNEHQEWVINLTGCKVSGYLIFYLKNFVMDLINDWSSTSRPDIYHFVPYTWNISIAFKEFELMTLTNEWNWIDCFGHSPENAHLAVCGDSLSVSFLLPYVNYLPKTVAVKFLIRGETAVARLFLPETNTSRHLVIAIANSLKVMDRNGRVIQVDSDHEYKWARVCLRSAGWVDVWSTPLASVAIGYTYHPIPSSGNDIDDFAGTPDGEETILVPVRLVAQRPLRPKSRAKDSLGLSGPNEFDPTLMEPDEISVDINIGASVCYVYGCLVSNFLNLKENYFGDDQKFCDFETNVVPPLNKKSAVAEQGVLHANVDGIVGGKSGVDTTFDPNQYRPLHVKVQLTVQDIQGHLVKNCCDDGAPCPSVFCEKLSFEMDKRYEETKLQVLISPSVIIVKDVYQRPGSHAHLADGHLALSGLQVRGHAMFSHKDLPLDSETLEYAWLLEVTIGDLTGRLTAPQLQNIVEFLQTFVYLFLDPENALQRSTPYRSCQHMISQPDCPYVASMLQSQSCTTTSRTVSNENSGQRSRFLCPTADELKYRFVRVTIDCIDLYLVESGSALNIQIYPVRLATCSLHSATTQQGISVLVPHVSAKQFVLSVPVTDVYADSTFEPVCWLEAGGVGFGPIVVDAALALPNAELLQFQRSFIALHDRRTRRLQFLWSTDSSTTCGCLGGCSFFGANRNGPTVFQPSEQDFVEGLNAAVVHVCRDGKNFGFGQSLLHTNETVFQLSHRQEPHLKRKSSSNSARVKHFVGNQSKNVLTELKTVPAEKRVESRESVSHRSLFNTLSAVSERDTELSDAVFAVPATPPPKSTIKTTDLTLASSVSSLSDSGLSNRRVYCHGRTQSYEPPKTFSIAATTPDSISVASPTKCDHKNSHGLLMNTTEGSHSRRSSLASPVLRRLSSQGLLRDDDDDDDDDDNDDEMKVGSLVSVVSSDQFYSAFENGSSSVTSMSSSVQAGTLKRQVPSSPTSDSFTVSSVYDIAVETPTVLEPADSVTDVESYVSAQEDQPELLEETINSFSTHDSSDDDMATFAGDGDMEEGSFDTDTTQVRSIPQCHTDHFRLLCAGDCIHSRLESQKYTPKERREQVPTAPSYVDLHGQINQPITKSPLLMSCYANHMTQLQCSNWLLPAPVLATDRVTASAAGAVWIPRFVYSSKGFAPELMVDRSTGKIPAGWNSPSPASTSESNKKQFSADSAKSGSSTDAVDPFTYEGHIKKTTAVVNLKGSVDIMVSPLMLEALQRYLEAVIPVLASLHPSAIIDSLHFQCTSEVEKQNKLKAAKQKHNRPLSSLDHVDKKEAEQKEQRRFGKKQVARESIPEMVKPGIDVDVNPGKSQMSRLQVILSLSKINVCVLQASLVEEVISIAALERARELTCVSVLAASVNHVSLQLLTSSITKGVDSMCVSGVVGSHQADIDGATEAEIHRDDIVGSLNISSVNLQLRRMKKHSNFSDQVFLTAIPEHRSQAYFNFCTQEDVGKQVRSPATSNSMTSESFPQSRKSSPDDFIPIPVEDVAGFIMFECGLEGIGVQVARRKGYGTKKLTGSSIVPPSIRVSTPPGTESKEVSGEVSDPKPEHSTVAPKVHETSIDVDRSPELEDASSDTSVDGNSADDEASSHRSKSFDGSKQETGSFSSPTAHNIPSSGADRLCGDAASGVLKFETVWFNFAAPPPSQRKRKLEYTRNDWNLLSTATPAINSWMNPCHRALQASNMLYSQLNKRICTIMACIMTEALDLQNIHMPVKSKYNKITDLSRTLQEDPSCQLLTVLRRYIRAVGVPVIEGSLNEDTMPQSITVKKGLLVLTRQWKNILYMPMLADPSFKTKKKLAVTFAVPMADSVDQLPVIAAGAADSMTDEAEPSFDNFDVIDERTSLLRAEGGLAHPVSASARSEEVSGRPSSRPGANVDETVVSEGRDGAPRIYDSNMSLGSSISSDEEWVDAGEERALTSNSLSGSPPLRPSLSQHLSEIGGTVPSTKGNVAVASSSSATGITRPSDSDLYRWMQRQQDFTATRLMSQQRKIATLGIGLLRGGRPPSLGQDSWTLTGASEVSQEDSDTEQRRYATALARPTFQLADAQVLFKPLLGSMGLESVRMSALMKELGGSLSLRGSLSTVRVKIIDSDFEMGRSNISGRRHDDIPKGKLKHTGQFRLNSEHQTPAFVCDSFSVQLSTRDIDTLDQPVATAHSTNNPNTGETLASASAEQIDNVQRRRSVRALRAALGRFTDGPHSAVTTRVDFVVSCSDVTQHVNMSLLRLTHQIVTMVENINKTRTELRRNVAARSSLLKPSSGAWTHSDIRRITPISRTQDSGEQHLKGKSPGIASMNRPGSLPGVHSGRVKLDMPLQTQTSPSFTISMDAETNVNAGGDASSPAIVEERTIVDEIRENTPKCWRTLYHLLDLYSTMPELKTVNRSHLSVIEEEEQISPPAINVGSDKITRPGVRNAESIERQPLLSSSRVATRSPMKPNAVGTFTQSILVDDEVPLVIFGVAKVKRLRIMAQLSGLKLEAELQNGQASITHREKVRGLLKRKSLESSITVAIGNTMIVLLEGAAPTMQTVVTVRIGKSEGLYSSFTKRLSKHNSGLLKVGIVEVDIPQHPVALHGMVARSSKRLSTTLQEFIRLPSSMKQRSADMTDGPVSVSGVPLQRTQPGFNGSNRLTTRLATIPSHWSYSQQMPSNVDANTTEPAITPSSPGLHTTSVSKPLVIHFKARLAGLTIGASLLPSLRAQYKIGEVTSVGVTGSKAQFTINLPTHSLSFSSKVPSKIHNGQSPSVVRRQRGAERREPPSTPGNLPSSASIDMPPVSVHAVFLQGDCTTAADLGQKHPPGGLAEGLTVREGNYLRATADVGTFEHILTTDLLNHLVFVQKVFMKEVNELVQKVSGADQPVQFWLDDGIFSSQERNSSKPLLYSFLFRLKGIQITATTPTNNAVRLETGSVELELSNRVKRVNELPRSRDGETAAAATSQKDALPKDLKVFVRAQVELVLALGTLLKNPMFEEAESEFQNLASFKTSITLRNALQDEMIPGVSKDQEALLIALERPVISILPAAFDKAVLVWLNYKNAYEYWTEQRLALNKEVQVATQQLFFKLPLGGGQHPAADAAAAAAAAPTSEHGTLFLQLTVNDLGICLPMNQLTQGISASGKTEEGCAALVLTLESTQISACSCGSLVSKGRFTGFCLRFADDFQVSWDEWKPEEKLNVVMNAFVVPHGTYEVCSRTINPRPTATDPYDVNAKWILSIQWQMRGIDIHLDTNIGKRLSAIGSTLTMLAGDQFDGYDEGSVGPEDRSQLPSVRVEPPSRKASSIAVTSDTLPGFVYDSRLDQKTRARLIETEMNEQAKLVQDLHQLRASRNTIEAEERKLHELQAALFHDFRQDILKRLKRQSGRATAIKDKLGISGKPSHLRSHSTGVTLTPAFSSQCNDTVRPNTRDRSSNVNHFDISTRSGSGHSRALSVDVADLPKSPVSSRLTFHHSPHSIAFAPTSSVVEEDSNAGSLESEEAADGAFYPASPVYSNAVELPPRGSESSSDSENSKYEPVCMRRVSGRSKTSTEDARSCKSPTPSHSIGNTSIPGAVGKSQKEPSVDFELDVKVDIESGKCTLHPKEPKNDTETEPRRTSKGLGQSSPRLVERKKSGIAKKLSMDATLLSSSRMPLSSNMTVFILPGVDVKVHYSSHTGPVNCDVESPTATAPGVDLSQTSGVGFSQLDGSGTLPSGAAVTAAKKNSVKKANLYAWLSLPPLPEEMLISPALLDFLEQAIEPIPVTPPSHVNGANKTNKTANRGGVELEASETSLVSSSNYAYTSFPVDVVVYVRIQPSLVRFTCLPVSRVECLLRLPSVDVVFSTKKADVEASAIAADTSPSNVKAKPNRRPGAFQSRTSSSTIRSRLVSGLPTDASAMDGGISITGSLSNFSLYIFHPYGGGGGPKKATLTALENTFRKGDTLIDSSKSGGSSLDSGRKDSLSLNVEFVKVNISRSRKGLVPVDIHSSGSTLLSSTTSPGSHVLPPKFVGYDSQTANIVRFSAICDIGSASFKYDMRRLLEILALPKAWYRRSLARRMFLGEELAVPDSDSLSEGTLNSSSSPSESSLFSPYEKDSDAGKVAPPVGKLPQQNGVGLEDIQLPASDAGVKAGNKGNFRNNFSSDKAFIDLQSSMASGGGTAGTIKSVRNWETLVLFAVSLSQLDVMVNMSNVMGNTVWSTKDLKSQGRLSIDSSGYKNMKISAGLGGSKLEARGGIIGGNIELQQLESEVCISEDPGKEPEHVVSTQLHIMEARLDYMGSSILMGRISDLAVKMNDEWHVEAGRQEDRRGSVATSRSVLVFVHGDLVWDRFHLMISRSTTPELIKMVHKLDEFITQQQTSSKRALSVFGPMSTTTSKAKGKLKDEDSWISEIRHHRHWQKVLQHMCGSRMTMLGCTLPDHGTVIGGTMSLQGRNITLACFHGINFRSKSWALFTMDEPYICFATEAADVIVADGAQSTHVVQNLSFQLGQYQTDMIAEKKRMAVVCKLSRGHYMPPPFTSVQEWFHYAFATSELKDLDTFPQMMRQETESGNTERRPATRRTTEYTHDTEIIFVLPSLQMHLKTEHLQGEVEPKDDDPKPVVVCSFVTEFEDHIFVAMDAEAVLFLHDLVMNYVKEKDRGAVARGQKSPEAEPKQKLEDPTSVLKQDFREFDCRTWHLEPTVRLLSWAGKRIDPVGVDYILQKLGFQHARLTIPKWTQRGCMDPLDKIISLLVDKLITTLREQDDE